jgi:catalase
MAEPTPEQAINRIKKVYGDHAGHRTLHAKGAFYSGTFLPTDEAAKRCRALHFQAEVPVLVRWSNGSGNPHHGDGAQDVRGLAVKFRLPDGTSTDLLGQTAPRFPVHTAKSFVELVEATGDPKKLPLFLARHHRAALTLVENLRSKSIISPRSYAEVPYYPIHAYRWIAPDGSPSEMAQSWVRYTFRPLATEADRLPEKFHGKNRLREELAARLARGPVQMAMSVQVAGPKDDPHDPRSVWKSREVFDAGTLTVTAVADDPEAGGSVVVFDPTRIVDGIGLSDDPILLYRAGAYSESINRRIAQPAEHQ